jgi:hypothetical protein
MRPFCRIHIGCGGSLQGKRSESDLSEGGYGGLGDLENISKRSTATIMQVAIAAALRL